MAWDLQAKEIEAVIASDAKRRYEYFIHRVSETRKLWTLYSDGWACFTEDGKTYLPFWPHSAYARRFQQGEWSGYEAREIEIHEFLERWVPGLTRDQIEAAVFPVPAGGAVLVPIDAVAADLREELSTVHGEDV
jgi:hypothetical protein